MGPLREDRSPACAGLNQLGIYVLLGIFLLSNLLTLITASTFVNALLFFLWPWIVDTTLILLQIFTPLPMVLALAP